MRQPTSLRFRALCLVFGLSLAACSKEPSSPSLDARTAQLQDLSQLRRYVALDAAYTDAERALALKSVAASEAGAGKWSAADFELQVERVVALADNGHSTVWRGDRAGRMNRIPARLLLFADGVFIVRARGSATDVLGARVYAVDGIPIAEVIRRLRVYRGGPNNLRDYDDVGMLESPQLLHAAGITESESELTLSVTSHDKAGDIKFAALPPASGGTRAQPLRNLAALPEVGESPGWRSAFQNSPLPLWLQEPDRAFRLAAVENLHAVYLQIKTNADADDGERIGAFLASARHFLKEYRPQNIILDMRFNGGGDYTKTASFMTDLHKMIPREGRVFVLTHTTTFSAGITSVGFVKQVAPGQTIIVGEPVGDRLIFYGEPRPLVLRNSRIGMNYATGLHDYLHGCRWFGPCYWVNWIYPVSVDSLEPDFSAPLSFAALIAGRDPAMELIRLRLKNSFTDTIVQYLLMQADVVI